jgi:putative membrane protein
VAGRKHPRAVIVAPSVWMYWKGIRFSNTAYLFMSVLIYLHVICDHHTFSGAPFDWVAQWLNAERNHFAA